MSTALLPAQLVAGAAAPLPAITRAAAATPLDARTPCTDWDLAALVRHQLHWAPFLAAAGRKAVPEPIAADESAVPLDGWPAALDAAHADVVAAWSDPAAWTGATSMVGPDEMPAEMIGGMVVGELLVHGWDLARTAGTAPVWAPEVLEPLHQAVVGMGEQGRQMGIFGPEVPVPVGARLLDRIVAITGRDPGWTR
jgi:uncharacterized protein (TIGR03086 family)